MSIKLLLLVLSFTSGFVLNTPVNIYKRNYNKEIIKVYEPEMQDKKDMNALIFYTGANSLIPADIYSNFIKALNNYNFSVTVVTNDNIATNELLYDIRDEYKNLIPLTHSSGYVSALQTINKQKNIKKAVFLDPVDNSALINTNLFDFFNDKNNFNYLESLLVLNAEKSYKGSIFPKLEIPFIPAFALDLKKLEKTNPDLNINKISAENYGHSDVLDSLWSDLMHGSSISKGSENRDQSTMDEYVNWLANEIYEFVNEDSDENSDENSDEISDENSVCSEEPIKELSNDYSRSILNLYNEDRYS
tara:strand:- start:87 stop:998 length:912 start_codon:yes stop_codon:yes gene_type:complete